MQHFASRQALQALTDRLVDTTSSASESDLRTIGADLGSVAQLLRSNTGLRRMLSDSSTAPEGRVGLVRQLLQGKVHETALALTQDGVGRSWASGADLRSSIDRLGRTALFLAAERTDRLDAVEDELFRFGRIVDAHPGLSGLLDDPTAVAEAQRSLVSSLLQGKADPITVLLLHSLATDTGTHSFSRGIRALVEQAAERRNELVAEVRVAVALDDAQQQRLAAALQRIYRRRVALHIEVDDAVLGGMRIVIGDEVIDGTAAGRLATLGRKLGA